MIIYIYVYIHISNFPFRDINLYTTQLTNIPFGGFDRKFPGSCEDLGEREDCCCHLRWTFWGIGDDQHRNNTILFSGVERG